MFLCAKCGKSLTQEQTQAPCPYCGAWHVMVLGVDQGTAAEINQKAKELADRHFELESGLTHVYNITEHSDANMVHAEPIKLLEVNENTVESGIMPLHFGPAPAIGIPYSSVIIEVTPKEFEKIRSHELKLPDGWEIGDELPRPTAH